MNRSSRLRFPSIPCLFLAALSVAAQAAPPPKVYSVANPETASGEDYKSVHPANRFTFGGSTGFGLVDTRGGFTLIGNLGAKIVPDGFIPDIVNPVFIEVEFGPNFVSGATFWMYSTHLRWDFVKDAKWTLFALGGFGGNFGSGLYSRVALHPRFGVGAFYALDAFDLRFEFSHELITAGVSVPF